GGVAGAAAGDPQQAAKLRLLVDALHHLRIDEGMEGARRRRLVRLGARGGRGGNGRQCEGEAAKRRAAEHGWVPVIAVKGWQPSRRPGADGNQGREQAWQSMQPDAVATRCAKTEPNH